MGGARRSPIALKPTASWLRIIGPLFRCRARRHPVDDQRLAPIVTSTPPRDVLGSADPMILTKRAEGFLRGVHRQLATKEPTKAQAEALGSGVNRVKSEDQVTKKAFVRTAVELEATPLQRAQAIFALVARIVGPYLESEPDLADGFADMLLRIIDAAEDGPKAAEIAKKLNAFCEAWRKDGVLIGETRQEVLTKSAGLTPELDETKKEQRIWLSRKGPGRKDWREDTLELSVPRGIAAVVSWDAEYGDFVVQPTQRDGTHRGAAVPFAELSTELQDRILEVSSAWDGTAFNNRLRKASEEASGTAETHPTLERLYNADLTAKKYEIRPSENAHAQAPGYFVRDGEGGWLYRPRIDGKLASNLSLESLGIETLTEMRNVLIGFLDGRDPKQMIDDGEVEDSNLALMATDLLAAVSKQIEYTVRDELKARRAGEQHLREGLGEFVVVKGDRESLNALTSAIGIRKQK
jgi:hypothetical protein